MDRAVQEELGSILPSDYKVNFCDSSFNGMRLKVGTNIDFLVFLVRVDQPVGFV